MHYTKRPISAHRPISTTMIHFISKTNNSLMAHSIPGAYFTLINHLTPTTHNIPNNSYIPTGHIVTWSVLTKAPFYPQQAISPLTTNSTLDSLFKKFFLKYCKTHKSSKVHFHLQEPLMALVTFCNPLYLFSPFHTHPFDPFPNIL